MVTAGWRASDIEARFPPNIPIGEIVKASIVEQEAQQQVEVDPSPTCATSTPSRS